MKNLQAYRDQLQELNGMIDKLEKGELSLEELAQMEKLTGELHAKSIILQYKAFEHKVNGNGAPVVENSVAEEAVNVEEEIKAIEEESSAIDFSIFDEEDDEEPEPFTVINADPEPEEVAPEIFEEEAEEMMPEEEEPEAILEPARETSSPTQEAVNHSGGMSFWEKMKIEDDSLGSRFAGSKLDSLIGAFGLNEKLRYINDLFDGSSEAFSDAVKLLDTQPNLETASVKAGDMALKNQWDPEEESVLEFMVYIKRRYA